MTITAAKYRRISDDREGRELGINRQDEDLDELAARRGYTIVASYLDNDIGASTRSKKRRDGYADMMADARTGKFKVILAYTSSRLTRRPREHEDLIDLAEGYGIKYEYLRSPSFDLNTSAGRRIARILAASDAGESEDISERVTRARLQQAQQGRFGGGIRPYGHRKDGSLHEVEAAEIVAAANAVLAGSGLRGIIADLNARGVATRRGGRWVSVSLRSILLQPRLAGLMSYGGEIIEALDGDHKPLWQPILDRDQWEAVGAILNSPSRRTTPGPTPKWLGSRLYRCGHPSHGGGVVTMVHGMAGRNERTGTYRCLTGHLVRAAEPVDDLVERYAVERLSRPDALALITPTASVDLSGLVAEANVLRVRMANLGDVMETGDMGPAEYRTRKTRLAAELAEVESKMTANAGSSPLAGIAGRPDADAIWKSYDLGRRRAVLDALMTVTILPVGKTGRKGFDENTVRIEPR